jgi:hypothetical protein
VAAVLLIPTRAAGPAGDAPTAAAPDAVASSSPAPSPSAAPPVPSAGPSAAPPAATASTALAALAALRADDDAATVPYDRDLFGQAWADVDRDGCDTRNGVLGRDLADPVFKPGTGDCKVVSGGLVDPYDGTAVAFASGAETSRLVQIDHVVALAWAWRHGAESWTDERRLGFANDPANLVAATEAANQAKSDSGPAEWLPQDPARACAFVERFVTVLAAYDLGIDDAERVASERVLTGCRG